MKAVIENAKRVAVGGHFWFDINWQKCYDDLKHMQSDIAVAWKQGDLEKMKAVQMKLINSFDAKEYFVL